MTNKTVKKWPMNDFLIALEKVFEEHGATLQATSSGSIGVSCGCYMRLDAILSSENIGNFINDSLRPENQIKEQKMACSRDYSGCDCPCCKYKYKEQKMEKQKYKSVPVTDMTIWQLGQAVFDGGEFYDSNDSLIKINDEENLESSCLCQWQIKRQLANALITTRQPLPWYEVEGVFPCLVECSGIFIATGYQNERIVSPLCGTFAPEQCTPLTHEQAAKYGVDHDA